MNRFLFAAILLLTACAQKHKTLSENPEIQTPTQVKSSTISRHFFLAETNPAPVNSSTLALFQASIVRVAMGDSVFGKVTFATLGAPDRVDWQICATEGQSPCKTGSTVTNEILWGALPPGNYQISLSPCVNPTRASDPQHPCGPQELLKWTEGPSLNPKKDLLLNRLVDEQADARDFGLQVYDYLKELKQELPKCATPDDPVAKQELEDAQILLSNFTNLGPEFVSYAVQGTLDTKANDQMTQTVQPALLAVSQVTQAPVATSTATSQSTTTSNYVPKGMSLADSSDIVGTLQTIYGTQDQSPLSDADRIRKALEGSTGFFESDGKLSVLPQGAQNPEDQSRLLGSLLLTDPRLSSSQQIQFGAYASFNALLNFHASDSGLHLSAEPCEAYATAPSTFKALRQRALIIKNSIKETQQELQQNQ